MHRRHTVRGKVTVESNSYLMTSGYTRYMEKHKVEGFGRLRQTCSARDGVVVELSWLSSFEAAATR
jgi:hypothetical protein